jgi:transcriptional regulator with XRE-family HTH domain
LIRIGQKTTFPKREQLADVMELAPRYIMSIENKGQHPSFQVFYKLKLVSLFDISVDRYLFPDRPARNGVPAAGSLTVCWIPWMKRTA